MKTLKESILDDIETNLTKGDEYVEAIAELDATRKINNNSWKTLVTGEEVYELKCPKWLSMIGLNEYVSIDFEMTFWDGDTDSKGHYKHTAEIGVALVDKTGNYRMIYGLLPYIPTFKTREQLIRYVNKLIKDNINSKRADKIKEIILAQL